jgi:hypothetical protein
MEPLVMINPTAAFCPRISRFLPLAVAWMSPCFAADCNLNGVEDASDIAAAVSEDCNNNGIPDLCEFVPLSFAPLGEPLSIAGVPWRLASGDLDGDARPDLIALVVAELSRLSIFFSRDARAFTPALELASPELSALDVADLDSDGDLDLVTANGNALRVYWNDGTGDFGAALILEASPGTDQLQVADGDLDGSPDLVSLDPSQGRVTWYRNLGGEAPPAKRFVEAGAFDAVGPVGNSSLAPLFLAAADLDGDDAAELVVAGGRERSVSILKRVFDEAEPTASFGFEVAHSFPVGRFLRALIVGDVNGDGRVDVAGATRNRSILLWRSLAAGGLDKPTELSLGAESLALSDVDGDATLDLVVGGPTIRGPSIQVGRGAGDGTFRAPQSLSAEGTLFRADDFDGDGDSDLAVATPVGTKVLFQGERPELSLERTRYPVLGGHLPHFMDVADFTGDGIPDVVTANRDPTFTLFFGQADGSLERHGERAVEAVLSAVVAVDLDRNGTNDLLFRAETGRLLALMNQGEGEFGELLELGTVTGATPYLGKADVDGDGAMDILAPSWRTHRFDIAFGDGRGGLDEAVILEVGNSPRNVSAGDLDSDGDTDLVSANITSSDISVLFQEERRRFAKPHTVAISGRPQGVALADFDRDGDLDVATGNEATKDVAIFLNSGDGLIATPTYRWPVGRAVLHVTVTDLDDDGFVDLVTTDGTLNSVGNEGDGISVLLGRGDGTFSRAQRFHTDINPRLTLSTDMDADGDVDLVVDNRAGGSVVVLLNQRVATSAAADFLSTICTSLDFELVSVADSAPLSERRTKFLLPAREDPALLATLFVNVARYPLAYDFLREVFPDTFGDLSEPGFTDLVLRRARRDYFAGSLRRLVLEDGSSAYGFDVLTQSGDATELLSREETLALRGRLGESFRLTPLVYLPSTPDTRAAAKGWNDPGFAIVLVEPEEPPVDFPVAHPTFSLEIPELTVLCGVFAVAGLERGPREEYALKTMVRLRPGTVRLPTESATFEAELIEEVVFGPERLVAQPKERGTFRLVLIPPNDIVSPATIPVTTYRFTYSQPFALADGRLLELEIVSPLAFQARGEKPIQERQTLPVEFFAALKGREALQARLDGEPFIRYGSCAYESLTLWTVEAELEDGTVLRLEERYEEAASLDDTAPASIVSAEVSFGAKKRHVTDYFELVYSASRHNTLVDYWVHLDPPVVFDGVGVIHAVELKSPDPEHRRPVGQAAYLDGSFQVLHTLGLSGFSRQQRAFRFRRGDANADGAINIVDVLVVLGHVFQRGENLSCGKAGDTDDDGRLNIVDAITIAALLFGRRAGLPEPFATCGSDPTQDGLTCHTAPPCP